LFKFQQPSYEKPQQKKVRFSFARSQFGSTVALQNFQFFLEHNHLSSRIGFILLDYFKSSTVLK